MGRRSACLYTAGGSMTRFSLPPFAVSRAVAHRTVYEIWYFVAGNGRMWLRSGDRSTVIDVAAGLSVAIPAGTAFQFRSDGAGPLQAIGVTMPPWPGDAATRFDRRGQPMQFGEHRIDGRRPHAAHVMLKPCLAGYLGKAGCFGRCQHAEAANQAVALGFQHCPMLVQPMRQFRQRDGRIPPIAPRRSTGVVVLAHHSGCAQSPRPRNSTDPTDRNLLSVQHRPLFDMQPDTGCGVRRRQRCGPGAHRIGIEA